MSWLSPDAYVANRARPDSRPDLYVGFSGQKQDGARAADTGQVGWDGPAEDAAADAHWLATLAFTALVSFAAGALATAALAYVWSLFL